MTPDLVTLAQQRAWDFYERKAHIQPRAQGSKAHKDLTRFVHAQLETEVQAQMRKMYGRAA